MLGSSPGSLTQQPVKGRGRALPGRNDVPDLLPALEPVPSHRGRWKGGRVRKEGCRKPEPGLGGERACLPKAVQLPGPLPAGGRSPDLLSSLPLSYQYCLAVRDSGEEAIRMLIPKQGHQGHHELRRGVIVWPGRRLKTGQIRAWANPTDASSSSEHEATWSQQTPTLMYSGQLGFGGFLNRTGPWKNADKGPITEQQGGSFSLSLPFRFQMCDFISKGTSFI